jgi:hypothetical protein
MVNAENRDFTSLDIRSTSLDSASPAQRESWRY